MGGQKLKGIPYTGTLPAVLAGTKTGYLHSYKIYGNMTQNGTPTPSDPIYPSECGERTRNEAWTGWAQDFVTRISNSDRARIETIDDRTCLWYSAIAGSGEYDSKYIFKIDWKENTQYTVSFDALRLTTETTSTVFRIRYTDGTYEELPSINSGKFESYTLTSKENKTIQDIIAKYTSGQFRIDIDTFMVNEDSTALPYEPYGYKLPLTSAGQDVDIYLGEATSTRQIRKLVLTGDETGTWARNSSITNGNAYYNTSIFANYKARTGIGYCTHYPLATAASATIGVYFGTVVNIISALSEGLDTADKWKTYLRQQYANSTPVTVWYVLATPTTGTLNEPLRKIGDYADTIDSTQTSAQIPTTANSTTISWAGQGLAPSEFDSVQEWVNIPTYTRVNGEWVADN